MGWLTGSGPSGLDWDWVADDQTLGLAPLVGVELHWEPSSRSGNGVSIRSCCRGKSGISLSGLSPRQEDSHTCGQCRFTTQFFIDIKLHLLLWVFFSWGGSSALKHPTPGSWPVASSLAYGDTVTNLGEPDLGGLGDDEEDCLQHSDEGLWHHLDLLLPLDQERCFCDPDHPVGESSLGHLASSLAHGSAEGEQVHKSEQPQWHLLLLEGIIKLDVPCRPAIAICLLNSYP